MLSAAHTVNVCEPSVALASDCVSKRDSYLPREELSAEFPYNCRNFLVSREEGNMIYGDCKGVIFPYSVIPN